MRRLRQEGMTLVEIMIVVIIMALIAGAVAVAVIPRLGTAKEKTAQTDVQTIRSAVTLYLLEVGDGCPTMQDLLDESLLDSGKNSQDPWNGEYAIECEGDNVFVTSAGPDGQMGTEDDI